ncbi:hypothetical protein DFH08DRAFT_943958 [Mycena albidolilacea]|uniref:Uncharacterized protein n=1 Tax=Mycena albidolilacea TaxID=1033008 RepID=A0AAD6Z739_9AGAR|nr:hypothetical protein DFH08DRAFT_943958 [Mycena albidolilacea]
MSATNTVVQQTSFGRIADEEQGFPDTRSNTRTSEPRPKMEPDSEAGGTVYKMAAHFMRKGKRKIRVVKSVAVRICSLHTIGRIAQLERALVAQSLRDPHCIGDTMRRRATRRRLETSRVPLFCVSWPSYGWKSSSITVESRWVYLGEDLGDLLVVTLNKSVKLTVEASLAIILVKKCELKWVHSAALSKIIGAPIYNRRHGSSPSPHPGSCIRDQLVFLPRYFQPASYRNLGGTRVLEQDLHPHLTQLNHTLLTIGVMTLFLPAAFFAALNQGSSAAPEAESFINDHVFLQMSRGLAVILGRILSPRNTTSPLKLGRNTRYCDRNTPRCQEAVELIWENIDNSQTEFVDGQSWATNFE